MRNFEQHANEVAKLLEKFAELENVKHQGVIASLCCKLSRQILTDPVIASDNMTYERRMLEEWIQMFSKKNQVPISPKTKEPLHKMGNPPNYFQPNEGLKNAIAFIKNERQQDIEQHIQACLNYVQILENEKAMYTVFLAQQLLRAILKASPMHMDAMTKLNNVLTLILTTEPETLFAIYGGTFMRLSPTPPNEIALLTLFLHYLTFVLQPELKQKKMEKQTLQQK